MVLHMSDDATAAGVVLHAGSDVAAVRAAAEAAPRALSVQSVGSVAAALEALADGETDAVVCETSVAGDSGLDLLETVQARYPSLPTLFLTDEPTLAEAAITAGSTDVFVRHDGLDEPTLLGRRLANVVPRPDSIDGDGTVALLRDMYDVTTDRESDYEQKIDALLRLGCETFDLPYGFLTEIVAGEDERRQTIVTAHGDHELLQAGESCPLREAYCRKTIESESLLAVANAETGFTSLERSAVRLMGQWVSYERQQRRDTEQLRLKNRAMDKAPVGITIADATAEDLPLVYANDEFERLTGYDSDEVVGRNCRFLQGPDTDPEPVREMRDHIDAGEPVSVELRNYRQDGTEFWNEIVIAPIEDEDGTPSKFVGFQQDVTDRKQRELERKLRDRAMAEAPVGITIHDVAAAGAPITYANEHFQSVTGYDADELVGERLSMLTGSDTEMERVDALDRAFESGDATTAVLVLERADGTPFWARVGFAPVRDTDGTVTNGVGFLQDITETKEHAETIERRLDEFGDLLAAELRVPLQEGRASLAEGQGTPSPADIEAAIDAIDRADSLVEDLTEVHSFSVKSRDVFGSERLPSGESQ